MTFQEYMAELEKIPEFKRYVRLVCEDVQKGMKEPACMLVQKKRRKVLKGKLSAS